MRKQLKRSGGPTLSPENGKKWAHGLTNFDMLWKVTYTAPGYLRYKQMQLGGYSITHKHPHYGRCRGSERTDRAELMDRDA